MKRTIIHLRRASVIIFLVWFFADLAYPATHLFRSVGTEGDLNAQGQTVEIAGDSAKFSGPVPARWGVGDVLQYSVEGKPHLAFIASRKSDTVFTLQSSTGGAPRAAPAGTRLQLYRAYTSLAAWARRDHNAAFIKEIGECPQISGKLRKAGLTPGPSHYHPSSSRRSFT